MELTKYRIFCNTENTFVDTAYLDKPPEFCPNHCEHILDASKTTATKVIPSIPVTDVSGKQVVHPTARNMNTYTYITGAGDIPNGYDVGHGEDMVINHNEGDAIEQHKYLDFNCIENVSFIHEGYIIWKECSFDKITLDIVPRVTQIRLAPNTNFKLYQNYLIIPSAGHGDVELISDWTSITNTGCLVYLPNSGDTGEGPKGFWDADYNATTKKFENLRPNPYMKGRYMLFAYEVVLNRFVNKVPLVGSSNANLRTNDTSELGHGMRVKFTTLANSIVNSFKIATVLTLHRNKTY